MCGVSKLETYNYRNRSSDSRSETLLIDGRNQGNDAVVLVNNNFIPKFPRLLG